MCSQFLTYPPTLSTITSLIVIKLTLYKEYWKVNFYIRRKYVHENQEESWTQTEGGAPSEISCHRADGKTIGQRLEARWLKGWLSLAATTDKLGFIP